MPSSESQASNLKSNYLVEGFGSFYKAFSPLIHRELYEKSPVTYKLVVLGALVAYTAASLSIAVPFLNLFEKGSVSAFLAIVFLLATFVGGPMFAVAQFYDRRKKRAMESLSIADRLALAKSIVDKAHAISVVELASNSALDKGFDAGLTRSEILRGIIRARAGVVNQTETAAKYMLSESSTMQRVGFGIVFGTGGASLFDYIKALRKASEEHPAFVDSLIESARYSHAEEKLNAHVKAIKGEDSADNERLSPASNS
jgi:cellobiose-specific phosphotransferase system component IIA